MFYGIGLTVEFVRIGLDLKRGRDTLDSFDLATIDERGGIGQLAADASSDLDRAARTAKSSPFISVLGHLPLVGSQIDALRDLTASAAEVGRLGRTAAARVDQSLKATKGDASTRVALVETVIDALENMRAGVARVQIRANGWLIPPLASARKDLMKDLAKAGPKLDDAIRYSGALHRFLVGPSKYLVLGGNNAEMRSFGIATTSGVSHIANGKVDVTDFRDVDAVNLPYPGVPIPPEFQNLYGWLLPGQGYESTVMSPNFPAAAEISSDISDVNSIGPIDGIVYTDTVTLQVLLTVIGPVEVDGTVYDEYTAAQKLINENYLKYQTLRDSPDRRKSQSEVAKAIFAALNTRDYSVTKLANALSVLARGRHLNLWAKDPDVNELWHQIKADGATQPDDFTIASQDLGASKLDYYVDIKADISVTKIPDGRRLSIDVTVDNPTKTGPTSKYIRGGSVYANPGEYGSYLQLSFPKEATDIVSPQPVARTGPDGPLQVVAIAFRVLEGKPVTQHFEMTLPMDFTELNLLPSARMRPITYVFNGQETNDRQPTKVDLAELTRDTPQVWYLIVGLILIVLAVAFAAAGAVDRRHVATVALSSGGGRTATLLASAGTALIVAQIVVSLVNTAASPFAR